MNALQTGMLLFVSVPMAWNHNHQPDLPHIEVDLVWVAQSFLKTNCKKTVPTVVLVPFSDVNLVLNGLFFLPGAEAESQGSAPSPASQQGGRNHQGPRGNKSRHRLGSNSHPPSSSSAAATGDEPGSSGGKKIGSIFFLSQRVVFLTNSLKK